MRQIQFSRKKEDKILYLRPIFCRTLVLHCKTLAVFPPADRLKTVCRKKPLDGT